MIGLYFGGRQFKTLFGNDYGNIELDANLEETHEWSAEATSNPVEDGAPVTDHVIENSDKLQIRGFVSDSTLDSAFSKAGFARISGIYNGKTVANRTQIVFDTLNKLIKQREAITVYTKHKIYTDMILTAVNIPRSQAVGEAIEFTAEFINIRKVQTQTVDVPNGISKKKASSKVGNKSESKKDAGKKQAETVSKPSSVLNRIFK